MKAQYLHRTHLLHQLGSNISHSLCRTNIKPPRGQLRVCSTVKCWPKVHVHAYKDRRLGGFQPYCKQIKGVSETEHLCGGQSHALLYKIMRTALSVHHLAYRF